MNKRASLLLSAIVLSPAASLAQDASVYYQGFNNYQLGDNVGSLMESVKTNSAATDAATSAITSGGKDFCNDIGLGSNKTSNRTYARNWNKGSDKTLAPPVQMEAGSLEMRKVPASGTTKKPGIKAQKLAPECRLRQLYKAKTAPLMSKAFLTT